ncbi:stage II sporulation protein E [Clostridiales bacterium]|nr:stage II sporulation protein E [Clostridiales bacterium]
MERTGILRTAEAIRKRTASKEIYAGGVFGVIGILLGAFSALGSFNPAGIACIMAFLGEGMQFYFSLLAVIAGFLIGNRAVFVPDYAGAVLMCTLYGFARERSAKTITIGEKAIAAFIIFLLSGAVKGLLENDLAYILIVYSLEGLIIFSLVYIFDKGISAVKTAASRHFVYRNDAVGLSAIAAFSIAGAASLYSGVLPIHIILGFYTFLTAGWIFGAETAAASGALIGLTLLLGEVIDTKMFVLISTAAVLSGAVKNGGRVITAASCISAVCVMGFYLRMVEIPILLGACAACILFLASSERMARSIGVAEGESAKADEEHYSGMVNYISERLGEYKKGIEALYHSLSGEDAHRQTSEKEAEELADEVACMVCDGCKQGGSCWNNSFYNTYQTLLRLFSQCEKNGTASVKDLPGVFKDYCINQEEFIDAVNTVYSSHRERLIWKMKLSESRQLAREQMGAVAEMLNCLAEEFEDRAGIKESLETIILYELRRKNSNVDKAIVSEGENGEYEVTVYKHDCEGMQVCKEETIAIISELLGRKMRLAGECQQEMGNCRLTLREKYNYKISAAAAMLIKDDETVSGDSYSFMELPHGGYMIALSDGMGSGKAAGEESRTVIELLEQFAESGFKRDLALKMINSVLVMSADEDNFATLDMCYIDMYSGSAEFIKTGAAATFVIRDGRARAIRSSSLPMGMLKYFDMDRTEFRLKKNDIILMLTDGAAEVIDRDGMSDTILTELMENNKMKDPKDIADFVLDSLKERSGFRIQDDMTVVAARVWG